MLPRFWLPVVKSGRLLPSVGKKSFLNSYPENIPSKNKKQKVAIFIGCMANYSYTSVGSALVDILKALDVEIMIPKKQLCCGAPAYFTGDIETVRYLIKKNIEYFEGFIDELDAIIIPEATCSSMIKIDWEHALKGEDDWIERSRKITAKSFIATEWLEKNTPLKALLASKNKKLPELITYHDPCHSRKTQGVWKEPRALIAQNYEMVEMENPNRCCGFGGVTIQTERFELARLAGAPKAAMIRDTKAQVVSAECSACRMQLTNAMYENGVDVLFKNPLELIAEALK
jgi:glycolate oxidase iron-sulfur subunit